MVIGDGLLAQTLIRYKDRDDVIIFASGVSNSSETRQEEFERETALLSTYFGSEQTLIYFSTCSVYDRSITDTMYIQHKLKMEHLIPEKFENYIIFRLPTLIADTPNSNTLFNFFLNNLRSGNKLPVHANACRYLLDIDDVAHIVPFIIEDNSYNRQAINIAFDNPITVPEMVKSFEEVLQVQANIELIDKGDCFSINNEVLKRVLQRMNFEIDKDNNVNCIKKYCYPATSYKHPSG